MLLLPVTVRMLSSTPESCALGKGAAPSDGSAVGSIVEDNEEVKISFNEKRGGRQ